VLRITREMKDHYIDPFRVRVVSPNDAMAKAIMDIYRRFPGRIPPRSNGPVLGGVAIAEVYVYPPTLRKAVAVGWASEKRIGLLNRSCFPKALPGARTIGVSRAVSNACKEMPVMKTTSVILELTAEEMEAIRESVTFSRSAVADSRDSPRELRDAKVAVLNTVLRKLPCSTPIDD
jgi:hypothetical protein